MRKYWILFVIVGFYLLIGGLYAAQVPAWQAPDEPAHYNYVRQLAAGNLPVIAAGDYDQAYLDEIRGAKFAPGYSVLEIEYEDWQPPLFYLLLTPAYLLTSGDLFALRFMSLLIGAGIIVLAFGIGRLLFPNQPWVAWSTAVFAAFLPQQLSILASVNNDSLTLLLIAAILYLLVYWGVGKVAKGSQQETRLLVGLGLLLGLGFLTKGTVYLLTAVIGVTILGQYWKEWKQIIRAGLLVFVPAFLLGAIWWVRNILVYGGLDILGKTTHDTVVVGQPRTAQWIAQFGLGGTIEQFLRTTFNSFWGQFGWMAVPMPNWVYLPLLVLVGTGRHRFNHLGIHQQKRGLPNQSFQTSHRDFAAFGWADRRFARRLQHHLCAASGALLVSGGDSDWAGFGTWFRCVGVVVGTAVCPQTPHPPLPHPPRPRHPPRRTGCFCSLSVYYSLVNSWIIEAVQFLSYSITSFSTIVPICDTSPIHNRSYIN